MMASIGFLAYAYIFKYKSVWKQQQEKYQLTNMFKQKAAMDHLHYYKFENDCFCMILSQAIVTGW